MPIPPAAILYSILAIGLLCAMDAAVKLVSWQEGVLTATWLRYLFGGLLLIPAALLMRRRMPDRAGLRIHALRGLLLTFTSLTFFHGIAVLPLAEAITLAFVAPLMVPPLAALFLKERMRGRAALAGVLGFIGVLVTVQGADGSYSEGNRGLAIASILVSATLYALQALILRARAQRDDAVSIAALAGVVPLALLTPAALALDGFPGAAALPAAALSGALGAAGILILTRAYALAEAQVLIVFEYTGLFWAALLGWFIFAERPRLEIFLGAAIIAGACILVSRAERPAPPAAPSAV